MIDSWHLDWYLKISRFEWLSLFLLSASCLCGYHKIIFSSSDQFRVSRLPCRLYKTKTGTRVYHRKLLNYRTFPREYGMKKQFSPLQQIRESHISYSTLFYLFLFRAFPEITIIFSRRNVRVFGPENGHRPG